ncbi:MAG: RNA-binding protein [Verrucomicrobia bacterium]|nr:RNA-binding protein [Verrucomicrobiota bacterium]
MPIEHTSNSGHERTGTGAHHPASSEETILSQIIQIERKSFLLSLRQNARGRFLKITEDVRGRRDAIIVPASGLADFKRVMDAMIEADRSAFSDHSESGS